MKILGTILICTFLMACNNTEEKKATDIESDNQPKIALQEKEKSTDTANILKQNGDYTELFVKNEKDCHVISTTEMASVLNLDANNINLNQDVPGYCRYELQLNDGTKTMLSIHKIAWDRKSVQSEIASYKKTESDLGDKNSFGGYLVLSDSKDTYFGIRDSRGELFMFNPNYDSVIGIKFGSAVEAMQNKMTFTEEQKKERLDNAIAIANFLLKKYKA